MKLSQAERDAVRKLCLRAIEDAKAHGLPGKSYRVPLVIPFPGEPFDRMVTLDVSAHRSDFR